MTENAKRKEGMTNLFVLTCSTAFHICSRMRHAAGRAGMRPHEPESSRKLIEPLMRISIAWTRTELSAGGPRARAVRPSQRR